MPTGCGHYRLPFLLARFAGLHPQVQEEVNISRNADLVAEGFDLAIRVGQFPESGRSCASWKTPRSARRLGGVPPAPGRTFVPGGTAGARARPRAGPSGSVTSPCSVSSARPRARRTRPW
ncbi:hypothetical protein [Pseudomonas sp. Hp2]|uniref:hypothetical protein n=1 Tax=Pseudomonas sp. Hp2 TaxID=701189 RepID=UPI0035579490